MKKTVLTVLLCVIFLPVLCVSAGATESPNPWEMMRNQIGEAEFAALCNPELYDEVDAEYVRQIDFSQALILVDHRDALMELGEMSLKEAAASSKKRYYIVQNECWYVIQIKEKEGAKQCSLKLYIKNSDEYEKYVETHFQAVANSWSGYLNLCGKSRDVLEVYAFSESDMHALAYVTKEGTFVRLYTGKYDGNASIYIDMPMEDYKAWVAAFRNYQWEFHTVAYHEFGDPSVNTLGKLMDKYGTTDAYYRDMEQIHQQKERNDFWFKTVTISVLSLSVVIIAWVAWRRKVNRKKYGY